MWLFLHYIELNWAEPCKPRSLVCVLSEYVVTHWWGVWASVSEMGKYPRKQITSAFHNENCRCFMLLLVRFLQGLVSFPTERLFVNSRILHIAMVTWLTCHLVPQILHLPISVLSNMPSEHFPNVCLFLWEHLRPCSYLAFMRHGWSHHQWTAYVSSHLVLECVSTCESICKWTRTSFLFANTKFLTKMLFLTGGRQQCMSYDCWKW